MKDGQKNALVVYYSRKTKEQRKKDTEDIARWISRVTGGEMFRLETVDEYPPDDKTYVDRLRSEDWHRKSPAVRHYINSISSYDVIFVGFPNYAGIVPRVVYTFLADYNLNGKLIVPFGINEVPEFNGNIVELRKVCIEAVVTDGLFVARKGMVSQRTVFEEWALAFI